MARSKSTHATTLSISLPPELAAAVHERVRSGLYGSASELLREALRRFLFTPAAQVAEPRSPWPMREAVGPLSERLRDTAALADARAELLRARLRDELPVASADEVEAQLASLLQQEREQESDPHLRPAPDRLRRLLDG
ncbi:MAG: ribbon-helix-helix protein, CopG family [Planctomycetes bacterium]|jgi:Arc/MetJ-type ribon-helix-helix transcriptional regulator|nr:ribbon-helix-helix protein, CopG family [Planctomycetota bacterium]